MGEDVSGGRLLLEFVALFECEGGLDSEMLLNDTNLLLLFACPAEKVLLLETENTVTGTEFIDNKTKSPRTLSQTKAPPKLTNNNFKDEERKLNP